MSYTVEYVDDFLSKEDLLRVQQFILDPYVSWMTQKSLKRVSTKEQFSQDFLQKPVTDPFFSKYIFTKIQDFRPQLKSMKPIEVYFNGQWPGRDGGFHSDAGKKTALLYVSDYDPEWGGFTQFLSDAGNEIIISPRTNRLVLFDAPIKHKAYSFCNQDCPMRISLAYKIE